MIVQPVTYSPQPKAARGVKRLGWNLPSEPPLKERPIEAYKAQARTLKSAAEQFGIGVFFDAGVRRR